MAGQRRIHVAAAQLPGLPLSSAAESLTHIEKSIETAADRGCELLVLPECAYPAYYLGGEEDYRDAGVMNGQAFVQWLAGLAAKHRINVVCGFVDDAGEALLNAAVVIDADGRECGRVHKLFLWGEDNIWFRPGSALQPVNTPLGRIGVLICADGRAPEIASGLVAQGAELIAVPTCWVNVADRPGQYRNAQAEFMIHGRVLECGVPLVAANKFGVETDHLSYCGWSMILDGKAKPAVQAPPNEAALIDASIQLNKPAAIDLPYWSLRRIFSTEPPVLPEAGELETVRIALLPTRLLRMDGGESDGSAALQDLSEQGVTIVGTHVTDEEAAEALEVEGHALGMIVVGYPFVERLMMESFGSYGCVASEHMKSFAPARTMALDGASIIFVAGADVPPALLRTRAAENRVFIAAATQRGAMLIGPSGQVLDSLDDNAEQPIIRDIDLKETANKSVFPRTHIWEQRTPEVYAKAFGVRPHFLGRD